MKVEGGSGHGMGISTGVRSSVATAPRASFSSSRVESSSLSLQTPSTHNVERGNFRFSISPDGKVDSPRSLTVTHKFGEGKSVRHGILGKPPSLDIHKPIGEMKNLRTLYKAPKEPTGRTAKPSEALPQPDIFTTKNLKTEWSRKTAITVKYPLSSGQTEASGPHGLKIGETTSTAPTPPRSEAQSEGEKRTTGGPRVQLSESATFPTELVKENQKKGVASGGIIRLLPNTAEETVIDKSSTIESPKIDNSLVTSLKRGEIKKIIANPALFHEKPSQRSEFVKLKQDYINQRLAKEVRPGKKIADGSTVSTVESSLGHERRTEKAEPNRIVDTELAFKSFNANIENALRIQRIAQELKDTAPAGTELSRLDPKALAIDALDYNLERTHEKNAIIEAEIGKEKVSKDGREEQVANLQTERLIVATDESRPSLEVLKAEQQKEAVRQQEIAQIYQEIADVESQQDEEDKPQLIPVIDNEANYNRLTRTLQAAQIIFEATASGKAVRGEQIASLLPRSSRPSEDVQSEIVKGRQHVDGSYALYLHEIANMGEASNLQQVASTAVPAIHRNNAVKLVESRESETVATKEEVLKVLYDRLAFLEQAA